MRLFMLLGGLCGSMTPALAASPDVVVSGIAVSGDHATIRGHLAEPGTAPLGITVLSQGVSYSAMTNPAGDWALEIARPSTSVDVRAWSIAGPQEVGRWSHVQVPEPSVTMDANPFPGSGDCSVNIGPSIPQTAGTACPPGLVQIGEMMGGSQTYLLCSPINVSCP